MVFEYHFGFNLRHHANEALLWRIGTLELVVCSIIWFLELASARTGAYIPGDSRVLSVKKGALVSLPLQVGGQIEHYNVLDRLHESGYDISIDFLG